MTTTCQSANSQQASIERATLFLADLEHELEADMRERAATHDLETVFADTKRLCVLYLMEPSPLGHCQLLMMAKLLRTCVDLQRKAAAEGDGKP